MVGAELFAKRRKKSEKWVVDETSRASQPTTPMTNMAPVTPAFTDLGVQRAQQTIKLNQIQVKFPLHLPYFFLDFSQYIFC